MQKTSVGLFGHPIENPSDSQTFGAVYCSHTT